MTLTDEEIIARYGAGEFQGAIARLDGRSRFFIRCTLVRNGIPLRDARQEQARSGHVNGSGRGRLVGE